MWAAVHMYTFCFFFGIFLHDCLTNANKAGVQTIKATTKRREIVGGINGINGDNFRILLKFPVVSFISRTVRLGAF